MNSMMLKHLIETIHKLESPVNLNFNSIFENLYTGLARSYVFCFLASHGSARLSFADFSDKNGITDQTGFAGLNLYNINNESKFNECISEFEKWVVGNSLCDAVHTYCLFLDDLYSHLLLFEKITSGTELKILYALEKAFRQNTALSDKLKSLNQRFRIKSNLIGYADAITTTRNSIVHNHGFVRKQDQNANGSLTVRWRAIRIVAITDQGENIELQSGLLLKEGWHIGHQWSERSKEFKVGDRIYFHPFEACEIYFFLSEDLKTLKTSLNNFLGVSSQSRRQLTTKRSRLAI